MIQKVRVITTVGPDLKGEGLFLDVRKLGFRNIDKISAVRVYRLEGINLKDTKILAEKLLSESINQKFTINEPIVKGKIQIVEIAYKLGVMNPEVTSIIKAASDLKIKLKAVDTSWEYVFFGETHKNEVVKIVHKLNLFNKLTETIVEKEPETLLIEGKVGKVQIIPIGQMSDEELLGLSKDKLFLNLEEMKAIQRYFQKLGRDPKDAELETLAQTWSEHSGHKTFKAELLVDGKKKKPLIKRIQEEALKHNKNIVSAFVDNSGAMDFYDGWAICGKVETHNSPSAIEPYGGAMTGSGGVFRDIAATGQGAKNIASTDIFCFAPLNLPAKDLPAGSLSPEYLLKKVVMGVKDYGNRIGIPTNNGSVHFHKDFRAKPTVIVGAYGILPKKNAQIGTPKKGDLIIAIGGRTGRDGIHGATFSSAEMTDKTIEINATAVQIGNAIEEKRMLDAIIEARDQGLIRMIQDVGGGGFSSAIGEIGEELGVLVDIKNAPLKYPGLLPWEIWVSESQERMIVVINPKDFKKFAGVCEKNNVEYALLGKFDGSKKLRINFGEDLVCDLDMEFLHKGLPKKVLVASHGSPVTFHQTKELNVPKRDKEWINILEKVLSHGNVNSKEPIVRLYDHSVGGTNDLQPFSGVKLDGPNDSPVIRPFLDKKYGVIISHGLNPILNNIDPYWGSIWASVEALSNYVSVGGDYKNASLINNYIWPFPDEESLWSLDQSVDAVVDFMKAFKIPVISGKDSLSSTYRGKDGVIKVPPVLCMSVFGKIKDTSKTVTSDFKKVGSTIVLVGKMSEALGGSVFLQVTDPQIAESVKGPKVDLKTLPKTFDAIFKGIQTGKILSSHDVSEGGVITAIFEMAVGGNCGVQLHLEGVQAHLQGDLLFNETSGMFVVEVEDEQVAKLFKDIPYKILGKTKQETELEISGLFKAGLDNLKMVWQKEMKEMFS